MVSLELIPENEDQQLPKKTLKSSPAKCNFSKNPPPPKIVTFSLGQKGSGLYEWAKYNTLRISLPFKIMKYFFAEQLGLLFYIKRMIFSPG